jgi:RNA polymerase sigma factor (sigma-70 family)
VERLDTLQRNLASKAAQTAVSIAARYARLHPKYADEIRSSANWGAVRAAASYVPGDGRTWDRWSKYVIRCEVREFLGSPWVRRCQQADDEALGQIEAADVQADGGTGLFDLDRVLAVLTPAQREVCNLVYKEGLSPTEAGRKLGLSDNWGCKLHKQAVDRLKLFVSEKQAA